MHASNFGALEIMRYLLDDLPEVKRADVTKPANNGETILMRAACRGYQDVVKYLIEEKGVFVDQANNDGWTALRYASQGGHLRIMRYLLDDLPEEERADLNKLASDGETVLMMPIVYERLNVVKYLIEEKGADVNQRGVDGASTLKMAVQRQNGKMVALLLRHDAKLTEAEEAALTRACPI